MIEARYTPMEFCYGLEVSRNLRCLFFNKVPLDIKCIFIKRLGKCVRCENIVDVVSDIYNTVLKY